MPPQIQKSRSSRARHAVGNLALVAALCLLLAGLAAWPGAWARAAGSVFTVNSTADGADANTSDGVCDDGAGHCTLRAAVQQANATPGADTINFQIGSVVQTVTLNSTLPDVTDPVVIDGSTQPGYAGTPLVEVLGKENASPAVSWALHVTAGGSTVRALALGRFSVAGILLGTSGTASAGGNKVESCYVGLRADGATLSAVGGACVQVADSPNNTVGGTSSGARNVLSGCSSGVDISGPNSAGNLVQGNYIGINAAGTAVVTNRGDGVSIRFASNNTVGGDTAAARNVISGNSSDGVRIEGGSGPGSPPAALASDNVVKGNYIGTNAAGTAKLPNTSEGVRAGGVNTIIGGLTSSPGVAPGNLISGQFTNLFIIGTGVRVQGNLVGTDVTGTSSFVPEGSFGISCWGPNAVIGGTDPGARNVISGTGVGISTANAGTNPVIQGNYIGTDASGSAALGNGIGIEVLAAGCQIGGTAGDARNVISGNRTGVWLRAASAVVQGNLVGTNAAASAELPNLRNGVLISSSARDCVVGGTATGAGNRIAFNGGNGVAIGPETFFLGQYTSRNAVRGNSIHSNGLLGIDLVAAPDPQRPSTLDADGVTPNDVNDDDNGPNGLQNAPVVTNVSTTAGTTTAQGTLSGKANATFTIDLYANAQCDASGAGEGQAHVGSTSVTTNSAGAASFGVAFPANVAGSVITATATDAANNTSEFSACHVGAAATGFQFGATAYEAPELGSPLVTVVVTRTLSNGAGAASVNYSTADGTATAGSDYTSASGTLAFAADETTKSFTVKVVDDARDEENETVVLNLSNATGGLTVGASASITIADDDAPPQLQSIAPNPAQNEGDSGTTPMKFGFRLNAPSGRVVTAQYTTLDLTATAGEDYQPVSGTLVFNPGETVKEVVVQINGDTTPEAFEDLLLQVSNVTNATLVDLGPTFSSLGRILDDDSPGFHFSAFNYFANERDNVVPIKIIRRGDLSAPASVYCATGDYPFDFFGAPSHRHDYTYTSTRLDFAPGESEKFFNVLVNDDAFVENPENINLYLSDVAPPPEPVNTRIAYLTLNSEDAQPPTPANNPLNGTEFFVRQHYHDFLSREPDAAGLQFWTGDIEQCGTNAQCREVHRISVSQAFFLSIEFQRTGYRVFRFYRATFPDAPERPRGMPLFLEFLRDTQAVGRAVVVGEEGWELRLQQNVTEFARAWVARPEVVEQLPVSMTAAEFVDKLFANSGVAPAAGEREAALAAYGAGGVEGRAAALLSVTESASVFNGQYNPAFVYMQYAGYLRRAPQETPDFDLTGFDFWLAKLDSFTLPGEDARDETVAIRRAQRAEMVKAFLSALEYRQRFGAP